MWGQFRGNRLIFLNMTIVTIMNLTCSAMVVWIDEAKKADYFSKHFVTLSWHMIS